MIVEGAGRPIDWIIGHDLRRAMGVGELEMRRKQGMRPYLTFHEPLGGRCGPTTAQSWIFFLYTCLLLLEKHGGLNSENEMRQDVLR